MAHTIHITPNETAASAVASKVAVTRSVFDRMLPELQARAICVAGMSDLDAVQRVRDAIAEVPRGGSWNDAKGKIAGEISPYLVTADEPDQRAAQEQAADSRAELLLRTHGFQAFAAARYRDQFAPGNASAYLKYVTEEDSRVRPEHAALDGLILPKDDPFWLTHYPPWDWGCRCMAIEMEDGEVETIARQEKAEDVPEDERSVLSPAMRATLNKSGRLARSGVSYDVAPRQGADAYSWKPGTLDLPLDKIMSSYDAETARTFSSAMQQARVADLDSTGVRQTVWDFLYSSVRRDDAKDCLAFGARTGREMVSARNYDTAAPVASIEGEKSKVVIRDVLATARNDGQRLTLEHNHPGGDPTPSPADTAVLLAYSDVVVSVGTITPSGGRVITHGESLSDNARKIVAARILTMCNPDGSLAVSKQEWYDCLERLASYGVLRYGTEP